MKTGDHILNVRCHAAGKSVTYDGVCSCLKWDYVNADSRAELREEHRKHFFEVTGNDEPEASRAIVPEPHLFALSVGEGQ